MVLPNAVGIYGSGTPIMNDTGTGTTTPAFLNHTANYSSSTLEGNYTLFNDSLNVLHNLTTEVLSTQHPRVNDGGDTVVYQGPPPRGLPIPLLIASPVAAVSILIFVCIAYYCHAAQLDARARELAIKMASGDMDVTLTTSVTTSSILSNNDTDTLLLQQRRSTLKPNSLAPPGGPGGKHRGSVNWSALADHELVTYSAPRRHSTFII